jgi:hypothetical protein
MLAFCEVKWVKTHFFVLCQVKIIYIGNPKALPREEAESLRKSLWSGVSRNRF